MGRNTSPVFLASLGKHLRAAELHEQQFLGCQKSLAAEHLELRSATKSRHDGGKPA